LDSGGKVELFASSGYVTAEAHIFQELRTTRNIQTTVPSGDILPNIHGVYQTDHFFHDTYLSFMGDIHGVQNFSENTASQRAIGEMRLTSPWTLPFGSRATASVSARYDVYNFKKTSMLGGDPTYSGMESRFLPSGYLEWSLPFSRTDIDVIQIITPRLRLTTMAKQDSPAFAVSNDSAGALLSDASLFSTNRYSGYDLWQSGTYADYGASWAAFDRMGRTAEVFFGQTYDFSEPIAIDPNSGYHDGASDYVGRLYLNTGKWFSMTNRFRFGKENIKLRHLESTARIGSRNYLEFGYIWAAQFLDAVTLDKSISEAVLGGGIHITERFHVKVHAIYNVIDKHIQRMIGGLYYDHPCYTIAFEYLKDNAVKEDYVGRTTFNLKFGIKLGTGGK
jgi:LPS-assembly protein